MRPAALPPRSGSWGLPLSLGVLVPGGSYHFRFTSLFLLLGQMRAWFRQGRHCRSSAQQWVAVAATCAITASVAGHSSSQGSHRPHLLTAARTFPEGSFMAAPWQALPWRTFVAHAALLHILSIFQCGEFEVVYHSPLASALNPSPTRGGTRRRPFSPWLPTTTATKAMLPPEQVGLPLDQPRRLTGLSRPSTDRLQIGHPPLTSGNSGASIPSSLSLISRSV
ncbi:hypothetical protein CRG98_020644 [Punica granatum]|uniref:Uncharacterized protein n=1 Tax=Punica granatum TaxID=22663 RepID=A0A2I0JRH2_PUNGR|nr:hypothetical protein CRG98_020644 [Punica granatum]